MKITNILRFAFLSLALAVVSLTQIVGASDLTVHNQDNSYSEPKCEEATPNEWHWVITQSDKLTYAPSEITVFFSSGPVTVDLEKVTGGVAHYRWFNNLEDDLVSPGSSVEIPTDEYANWSDSNPKGQLLLSHGPCVKPLVVSKTANTYYKRTWDWNVEKSADQTDLGKIESGNVKTVNYSVKASATSTDSDWLVSGTISITNPPTNPVAVINSVSDISDQLDVSGVVPVNCASVTFPYSILPGYTLNCTYSAVSDGSDSLNTVTVTTSGVVPGNFATATVAWGNPSEEIDECVTLNDTNSKGPQGVIVCNDDLTTNGDYEISYSVTFSKDQSTDVVWNCKNTEYENIASISLNDTQTVKTDNWILNGNTACFCSYSQGYWFAKPNLVWSNPVQIGWLGNTNGTYSQLEGKSIWNSSNKGGIPDSKKGFLQVAAIKLSGGNASNTPASLYSDVTIVENWLATKNKLSPSNLPTGNKSVSEAAGRIGNWIDNNHCVE